MITFHPCKFPRPSQVRFERNRRWLFAKVELREDPSICRRHDSWRACLISKLKLTPHTISLLLNSDDIEQTLKTIRKEQKRRRQITKEANIRRAGKKRSKFWARKRKEKTRKRRKKLGPLPFSHFEIVEKTKKEIPKNGWELEIED